MKLFTKIHLAKLLANGFEHNQKAEGFEEYDLDFQPVVKLFTPAANCTWLLTEIDPEEPDRAFGLCDLGLGSPELGYVSLSEIQSVRDRYGLGVERDRQFRAEMTISAYAEAARADGHIKA